MQSSFQNKNLLLEQKASEEIQKIKNLLEKEGYFSDNPIKKNYNYEINISNNNEKIKLLVYFGQKGLKTVIQGNTNSEFYKKINSLINMTFEFEEEKIEEPESYIGSDESGKGDFFGPLIIVAFAYDNYVRQKTKGMNIRDSKEISSNEIKSLGKQLRKSFNERISVIEIHPEKYNKLYESFRNLNNILIWAHSKAISELRKNHEYNFLVIDKFCQEDLIVKELSKNQLDYSLILTEKAERFKGVAIASIIARERLLYWFDKKSKELNIKIPLGASEIVNDVASHIKHKFGNEILSELIKLHFKNFKNI